MIHDWRIQRNVIALGISIGLLSGYGHAWAGEQKTTTTVVRPYAKLQGEPASNTPTQEEPRKAESNWRLFGRSVVNGFTNVFKGWRNPAPSDAVSTTAANVQKVTLGEKVILKKVASEEYTLIEGATVQPSRSTALQQAVSLPRAAESLVEAGIDLKVVRAEIGARIADMLGDELRGTTSTGTQVTIDGNVWEKARIDWFAKARAGTAILEVKGATHELSFEYTIGFEPKVAGTPRRRPDGSRGNGAPGTPPSTFESSVARVTVVSASSPDLFEARFEAAPAVVQGDKLPVFRGGVKAKFMGYCEVVAVRGPRIVARCEGFRPKVGDFVGKYEAVNRLDRTQ